MADEELKERFSQRILNCTDDEIVNILKKRSYYNPVAAEIAIKEAIKRGLINSEDDLLAEEYRVKPLHFSLFPEPSDKSIRDKLIKSLSRGVLFAGTLPTLLGIYRFTETRIMEGVFLVLVGIIWIFSAIQVMRKRKTAPVYLVLLMSVSALVYTVKYFLSVKVIGMDIFIAFLYFGMVFYSLLYLFFLLKKGKS